MKILINGQLITDYLEFAVRATLQETKSAVCNVDEAPSV